MIILNIIMVSTCSIKFQKYLMKYKVTIPKNYILNIFLFI
jgi:hypothetical protein